MLDMTLTTDDAVMTVRLTEDAGASALVAYLTERAREDAFLAINGACRLSVEDDGAVYTHDAPETVQSEGGAA
jgi:hypothetical protein